MIHPQRMTVDVLTSLTTFALIFPAELPDKTFIGPWSS